MTLQDMIDMVVMWLAVYAAIGALFAFYFAGWGAQTMDPGHEHSSFVARLILLPGVVALWPYLLLRMLSGAKFNG